MKKLLLITGDLATGKSTFANILSKRYDTNVFYREKCDKKEVLKSFNIDKEYEDELDEETEKEFAEFQSFIKEFRK